MHVLRRGLANAGGAEKVGKCFALFVSEAVSGAVGFADAVEAEAAEVAAQLAPCGQGPNRSPELKGEWADSVESGVLRWGRKIEESRLDLRRIFLV